MLQQSSPLSKLMQGGITPPPTPIGRLDLPANYHSELPQHASDWCTISWCKDTPGAIEDPPLVHYELPSKQVRPLSIRQTCWQPNQPHFSHEHHCHCQYHQHRHHLATNKTSVKDPIAAYQHHKHIMLVCILKCLCLGNHQSQ